MRSSKHRFRVYLSLQPFAHYGVGNAALLERCILIRFDDFLFLPFPLQLNTLFEVLDTDGSNELSYDEMQLGNFHFSVREADVNFV